MRASCLTFGRRRSLRERRPRGSATGARPRSCWKLSAAGRKATAAAERRAGPSAASPLLPDAQRHRLRRGSLHPTPRRSQRRLTPFFSSLLELLSLSKTSKESGPNATDAFVFPASFAQPRLWFLDQ